MKCTRNMDRYEIKLNLHIFYRLTWHVLSDSFFQMTDMKSHLKHVVLASMINEWIIAFTFIRHLKFDTWVANMPLVFGKSILFTGRCF